MHESWKGRSSYYTKKHHYVILSPTEFVMWGVDGAWYFKDGVLESYVVSYSPAVQLAFSERVIADH